MKAFTILIIDDDYYKDVQNVAIPQRRQAFHKQHPLYPLCELINGNDAIGVYLSKDGAVTDKLLALHSDGPDRSQADLAGAKFGLFLRGLNIVILDLGGITLHRPLPTETEIVANLNRFRTAIRDNSATPVSGQAKVSDITTGEYRGIGFYHQHLDDLCCCDAVIVLTQYDSGENSTPAAVKEYLWPFCQGRYDHTFEEFDHTPAGQIPWTTMAPKSEKGGQQIKSVIESRLQEWEMGITDPANQGAKELAALHDDPVILLGETGTGKEKMARSIHERWVREHRRNGLPDFPNNFVPVNCAGLSTELARSELFGHIAGSFTDAKDHRLGAILKACGVSKLAPRKSMKESNFKKALAQLKTATESLQAICLTGKAESDCPQYAKVMSGLNEIFATTGAANTANVSLIEALFEATRRLERASRGGNQVEDFYERLASCEGIEKNADDDLGLRFSFEHPQGTLFLDEFGDLPLSVQTLLLRFLDTETGEIQPLGYPSGIAGLKVRLIVATSDPRVAEFFGIRLQGGRRSEEEERIRPLRHDLLFRLKHQVIRVEPVTKDNAARVIDDLIGRIRDSEKADWTEAKQRLEELVKQVLEEIKDGKPRAFGHRREISQFLKRALHFVIKANDRGLRGVAPLGKDGNPKITRSVVERLWRPATVSATPLSAARSIQSVTAVTPWTLDQFERNGKLKKHTILYHIIEILHKKAGTEVSGENIAREINGLGLKGRDGKKVSVTATQIIKKISDLNARVLTQKCADCGFVLLSNTSGYKLKPVG